MTTDKPVLVSALSRNTALYDAGHVLPVHKTRLYSGRPTDGIEVCFVHHSGADGAPGLEGLVNSTRYVVRRRRWPGCPYTFWVPRISEGRAVYRCQPDRVRSYHTGGAANTVGIAVCFQGNLKKGRPTDFQYEAGWALLQYVRRRFPGIILSTHSRSKQWGGSGKKSCPGASLEEFVRLANLGLL